MNNVAIRLLVLGIVALSFLGHEPVEAASVPRCNEEWRTRQRLNVSALVPDQWIVGEPLWVALTVNNVGESIVTLFEESGPFVFSAPPHEVEFLGSDGSVSVEVLRLKRTGPDAEYSHAGVRVEPGHGVRVMFQVAVSTSVPSGSTRIRIRVLTTGKNPCETLSAVSNSFVAREPTESERAMFREWDVAGEMSPWLRPWPEADQLLNQTPSLRFMRLLRALFEPVRNFSEIKVGELGGDGLSFFRTEINAMTYELAISTGSHSGDAEELRRSVTSEYPETAWLFDWCDRLSGPRGVGIVAMGQRMGRVYRRRGPLPGDNK